MMPLRPSLAVIFASLFFALPSANAYVHSLPRSLVQETLSESVPTAFAPNAWEASDFVLEWVGSPLPGVELSLGRKSLEWVRVADVLVVPRARLLVRARNAVGGVVANGGFIQPLIAEGADAVAELPLALISGERNPIQLTVRRQGQEASAKILVRFHPRLPLSAGLPDQHVYRDPSCSPYKLKVDVSGLSSSDWVYLGCRMVAVEGDEHRTSSLEVFVFWDNVGQSVKINGIDTSSSSDSVWALRLKADRAPLLLSAGGRELSIRYSVPARLNFGSLGLGVGPYTYIFDSPGTKVHSVTPLLTLYGSFFIFETVRLVTFGASALSSTFNTDVGVYLVQETLKTLDRRISMNVMLGGHSLGFEAAGSKHVSFGAPQGVEVVFRDAGLRGHNLTFGSFLYPPINGTSYYNLWLRWGTGSFFGEFNYIGWQQGFDSGRVYSRNVGLSIGFPLVRFL